MSLAASCLCTASRGCAINSARWETASRGCAIEQGGKLLQGVAQLIQQGGKLLQGVVQLNKVVNCFKGLHN